MFPVWVYAVAAAAIALLAFGIGQVWPGLGVPFVALLSLIWVAYSVARQRAAYHDARLSGAADLPCDRLP